MTPLRAILLDLGAAVFLIAAVYAFRPWVRAELERGRDQYRMATEWRDEQ